MRRCLSAATSLFSAIACLSSSTVLESAIVMLSLSSLGPGRYQQYNIDRVSILPLMLRTTSLVAALLDCSVMMWLVVVEKASDDPVCSCGCANESRASSGINQYFN
jgi:hypothetical protein